jgi:hypothetical protein
MSKLLCFPHSSAARVLVLKTKNPPVVESDGAAMAVQQGIPRFDAAGDGGYFCRM